MSTYIVQTQSSGEWVTNLDGNYTLPPVYQRDRLTLKNTLPTDITITAYSGQTADGDSSFTLGGYCARTLVRGRNSAGDVEWTAVSGFDKTQEASVDETIPGNLTVNGTTTLKDSVIVHEDNVFVNSFSGPEINATTTAVGGAFTNQPANDSVDVVSDDNTDKGQVITIIGTTHGTDTVVVESITLNGTTAATSVKTTWGVILAVKMNAVAAGTVTIRESSADATITTLATTVLSVGVNTVAAADQLAWGRVVEAYASGATTKQIGIKGTNTSDVVIYDSQALNGTTAVSSNSTFRTVTEVYTGDLENTVTAVVRAVDTWEHSGGSVTTTYADGAVSLESQGYVSNVVNKEGTYTVAGIAANSALSTTTAVGLAYANQPANDKVAVVSDDAADIGQVVTVIGTTHGTDTLVTEDIVLNGTTAVASVKADWGLILAVKLSASCAGTVTIRENSGSLAITTILTTVLSSGVKEVTAANSYAYNRYLSLVADGATTKQLGLKGTNTSDAVIYDSQALTGTTSALSNSTFRTVTEIYTGDLEATRTATITNDSTLDIAGSVDFAGDVNFASDITVNGRASTVSAAGSAIQIDASTWTYAEGLELRYNMADWADVATFTDTKALYLRMETNEAAASNSLTGAEIYGVTNNVDLGNICGVRSYAYVKGATAKTILKAYGSHSELSWDAGAAATTITTEAASILAKITGGAAADYTKIHGIIVRSGDMDGQSRTYGNAITIEDDADMAGTITWTNGLKISSPCTYDIQFQGGATINQTTNLKINTSDDSHTIRLNSRNYAATSGDIIGFQSKPAGNASGTQTVYGGQISPRFNDDVDGAALVGLQVEPILKGATVLALSGDMRGLDVRLTSEGANTVGGIAGGAFFYNLLPSSTYTGGVYPIVVTASGSTQEWTGFAEIPTGITNAANGGGADVYINITINGVAARIAAKYVA